MKQAIFCMTQVGTDDPTVTELSNTYDGNIVWTRDAMGVSKGYLPGAFTVGKTFIIVSPLSSLADVGVPVDEGLNTLDEVYVSTYSVIGSAFADNFLSNTLIKIETYP